MLFYFLSFGIVCKQFSNLTRVICNLIYSLFFIVSFMFFFSYFSALLLFFTSFTNYNKFTHEHEHFIHGIIFIRTNLHAPNRVREKKKLWKERVTYENHTNLFYYTQLFDLNLFSFSKRNSTPIVIKMSKKL